MAVDADNDKTLIREKILAWIEQQLVSKGFKVKRKGLVNGEGISHVFDLLAEYSPLPGSTIRIGIIVVDREDIGLDFIEKMMGWLGEFHSLKIILVPLKRVEHRAHLLAQRYGIDIVYPPYDILSKLDLEKTKVYTDQYRVRPIVDLGLIKKRVADKTKRSLFRTSKCSLEKLVLTYYPLIELKLELPRIKAEIEEAEVVEGKIVFDGLYGFIVTIDGGALRLRKEYGSFIKVPEEAFNILRVLSEEGSAELDVLSARTKLDQHTIKSLLVELSMHNLVEIYGDLVELKPLNTEVLVDLSDWVKRSGGELEPGIPIEDDVTIVLSEKIPLYRIEELLNSMGAEIIEVKTIYYPLYTALLKEISNGVSKEKIGVFNGINGVECEEIGTHLTTPEFIDRVREKKGIDLKAESSNNTTK